jgi:polysaccharide export outer membrane protein
MTRYSRAALAPLPLAVLLLGAMLTLAGCENLKQQGVSQPGQLQNILASGEMQPVGPAAARFVDARYLVTAGDQLDLVFPYNKTVSTVVVVLPDGMVTAPEVGTVQAGGLTVEQIENDLRERYRQLAASEPSPEKRHYLIHARDELEIKFPYAADFNEQATVRPDGRISLPLVKTVIAEGKTPEQLERELYNKYKELIPNPELVLIVRRYTSDEFEYAGRRQREPIRNLDDVQVAVRQFSPLKVYVAGEVNRPGAQALTGPVTALQAIVEAGGRQPSGEMRNVLILRRGLNDKPIYIVRDLAADLDGTAINDILLKPFDVVVVPKTAVANVRDILDQYVYNLIPALRNSSLGFYFTDQISSQPIKVSQ